MSNRWFFKQLPYWAGIINVLAGLLIMLSWLAHWQKILQLVPGTAPMQFNTALGFSLSGLALCLLATRQNKYSVYLGVTVVMLAVLTLLEYVGGWDFHIDQLFCQPFFEVATTFPGRMPPLAAVCFILIGTGLMLAGSSRQSPRRLEATGVLMCIVAIIAVVALVGSVFGIVLAYGWGAYSSLALNTTILLLVLSGGLLMHAWQKSRHTGFNFLRWLPVTGSFTLMIMVAIIAANDVSKLKDASFWRKHTIQVLFTAQAYENTLSSLQRGVRGYAALGDTNGLTAFKQARESQKQTLATLMELTADNATQQQILNDLNSTLGSLLVFDDQLIKRFDERDNLPVFDVDTEKENRTLFGRIRDLLDAFIANEQKLLDSRDVSEQTDIRHTERLLIAGCALAIGLLLLAHFMASYELAKRKRVEIKLAEQADALRRSNIELEQFAYVASHDLREPLRSVTGFAQLLRRQSENQADEKSVQTIGRIVDAAKRMSAIIDDLLALSSISSQKKRFEKTRLEIPLSSALENLAVAIKERDAMVRHEALPALLLDASQVTLLFQNLIGNAIKFCPGRRPEIQIVASRQTDHFWTISVRDNGIGIEPKYFDRIFGVFQRLHTRDTYPGTGIGLAICKKIIERHGGRIWLESTPGAGTVFYFTLGDRLAEEYESK